MRTFGSCNEHQGTLKSLNELKGALECSGETLENFKELWGTSMSSEELKENLGSFKELWGALRSSPEL